jgi:hypothetical protein
VPHGRGEMRSRHLQVHGLAELIRLDLRPGQLLPRACQDFAVLIELALELIGPGLSASVVLFAEY